MRGVGGRTKFAFSEGFWMKMACRGPGLPMKGQMQPESLRITKVVSAEQLGALRPTLAARGQTLVQCHGCFDIVHPGHIRHLRFAAAQGDRLVISVTADAFVNKGPGRPMFSHDLRAENMAALEFVDWVVIHHAPTATDLLKVVRPDIYIKGAEYAINGDPRFAEERGIVESFGGRVLFSSGDVVFSSTSLVESIRAGSEEDRPSIPMRAVAARGGP